MEKGKGFNSMKIKTGKIQYSSKELGLFERFQCVKFNKHLYSHYSLPISSSEYTALRQVLPIIICPLFRVFGFG